MHPSEKYEREAPAPAAPTMREAIRYIFDEIERRSWQSVKGLTDADLNEDPGERAMSIGANLHHQLGLIRFLIYTMDPKGTEDLPLLSSIGEKGDWHLAPILAYRETLCARFHRVFTEITDDALMGRRPDLFPTQWAEWPVLMRILRPLVDRATHVGQVNYARRQLGKPVGPDPIRDRRSETRG